MSSLANVSSFDCFITGLNPFLGRPADTNTGTEGVRRYRTLLFYLGKTSLVVLSVVTVGLFLVVAMLAFHRSSIVDGKKNVSLESDSNDRAPPQSGSDISKPEDANNELLFPMPPPTESDILDNNSPHATEMLSNANNSSDAKFAPSKTFNVADSTDRDSSQSDSDISKPEDANNELLFPMRPPTESDILDNNSPHATEMLSNANNSSDAKFDPSKTLNVADSTDRAPSQSGSDIPKSKDVDNKPSSIFESSELLRSAKAVYGRGPRFDLLSQCNDDEKKILDSLSKLGPILGLPMPVPSTKVSKDGV
jgi:hypothetical protein